MVRPLRLRSLVKPVLWGTTPKNREQREFVHPAPRATTSRLSAAMWCWLTTMRNHAGGCVKNWVDLNLNDFMIFYHGIRFFDSFREIFQISSGAHTFQTWSFGEFWHVLNLDWTWFSRDFRSKTTSRRIAEGIDLIEMLGGSEPLLLDFVGSGM